MAFDAGSVVARIKADLTEFQAGLKKAQDAGKTMADKIKGGVESMNTSIKGMEPQLKKAGVAFAAIAAGGTLMLRDWMGAASGAEVEMARFDATLKATGKSTDAIRKQLLAAADAGLKMGFDDEESANVMANFFQRTNDATEAIKLNSVAMDLARKKNIGLADAGNLVNQVLSGNGKVLKQYGIDIKESASPLEALAQLQEVVGGQSAAFMETAAGKSMALSQQISSLKENLGAALLPIMTQVTEVGMRLVGWLNSLSPEMTKAIAYFTLFVTVAAAILAPITGFVLLIPTLTAGLGMLATVLGAIFSPIGLLVIAIGALYAAWSLNLFGIQEKTAIFFQMIVDLLGLFKFGWESDWFYIQTIVTTVFDFLVDYFTIYWETIKLLFSVALAVLRGDWAGAWEAMKVWAKNVFDIVEKWAGTFWEGITAIFKIGGGIVGDLWSSFMDGIKNIAHSVWEGIKQTFVDGLNWIIGKMNAFINAINGMSGALGRALGLGKKGFNLGTIPTLAQGGIVTRPTLAMIGEGGESEAVIPLSKLGNVGAGGVHIHLEGAIYGSIDAAVEMLDEAMRRVRPSLGV